MRVNHEKVSLGEVFEGEEGLLRPLGEVGEEENLCALRLLNATFDELMGDLTPVSPIRLGVPAALDGTSVAHAGTGSKVLLGDFELPLLPPDCFLPGIGRPRRISCIKSKSLPIGFAILK